MFSRLINELENEKHPNFILKYWDSAAHINIIHKEKVYENLIKFLSTHFEVIKDEKLELTIGNIYFCSYKYFNEKVRNEITSSAEFIQIRRSSAVKFNIDSYRYIQNGYQIFEFDMLNTSIIISKEAKKIYIFASEDSEIVLAEFFRDLYIKDQERLGSFILHAAAIEKDGNIYAICGEKGAGKSTILYNMIFEQGFSMFSGDKVIAKIINDRFYVKGWPDYPHLGIGTIKYNRKLSQYFKELDLNNRKENEKILFNPIIFYEELGLLKKSKIMALTGFIFPRFCEDKSFEIKGCSEVKEEATNNLEFKECFEIANWYRYLDVPSNKKDKQEQFSRNIANYPGYMLIGNIHKNTQSIEL